MAESTKPVGTELIRDMNTAAVFADGVSVIQLGYPMSRIVFTAIAEPDSPSPEARRVTCDLTMPTLGLFDLAKSVLRLSGQVGDEIVAFHAAQGEKLASHITALKAAPLGAAEPDPAD